MYAVIVIVCLFIRTLGVKARPALHNIEERVEERSTAQTAEKTKERLGSSTAKMSYVARLQLRRVGGFHVPKLSYHSSTRRALTNHATWTIVYYICFCVPQPYSSSGTTTTEEIGAIPAERTRTRPGRDGVQQTVLTVRVHIEPSALFTSAFCRGWIQQSKKTATSTRTA